MQWDYGNLKLFTFSNTKPNKLQEYKMFVQHSDIQQKKKFVGWSQIFVPIFKLLVILNQTNYWSLNLLFEILRSRADKILFICTKFLYVFFSTSTYSIYTNCTKSLFVIQGTEFLTTGKRKLSKLKPKIWNLHFF